MKLRDYQEEDVASIFTEWEEVKSTLYVAATGLGKTRVMTELAHRVLPKRTLFLCHRTELIAQAQRAFLLRGMECEIEKAELQATTNLFSRTPVVLASVQTLLSGNGEWKRMNRFDPKDFGLLLYDESHHSVSPGNKRIVDYFTNGNSELRVCGVTATPDRADEEALGQIFETVASERDILWGRDNGWLVDVCQLFVPVAGLDFSDMRTTAGDLNGADLAAVMETESCVQGVVQPTVEHLFELPKHSLNSIPVASWGSIVSAKGPQHRVIVFTVSVDQAEMLSNIFNRVVSGISSWVCGKTRDEDRLRILSDFKDGGPTRILVNCGVTTEGYDNPAVDTIVMARPTKSRSLYAQCIGRGTRPIIGLVDGCANAEERRTAISSSSKPHVTVLDFVGNSGTHKLLCTANLLAGKVSDEAVDRAVKIAKERGQVKMSDVLSEAEEELRKEAEKRRLLEEARKNRLVAKAKYTTQQVSPFDVFALSPVRERGWDSGKTLTEKQRALLLKQGIDGDAMPYVKAKAVLNEMFRRWNGGLATFKQCKLLQKHGYDTKDMTMKNASALIDGLAKNNWKRPTASPPAFDAGVENYEPAQSEGVPF